MGIYMSKATCLDCTIAKPGICKASIEDFDSHLEVHGLQLRIDVQTNQLLQAYQAHLDPYILRDLILRAPFVECVSIHGWCLL